MPVLTRDLTVSGGHLTVGPGEDVRLEGLPHAWRHRVDQARGRA